MHENPGPKKFGDFLGGYFVGKILRVALWRRRFLAAPAARNIPRRFLEGALTYFNVASVLFGDEINKVGIKWLSSKGFGSRSMDCINLGE